MSEEADQVEAEGVHAHPGPREYVGVAVVLAIITAAEVGIYYVSGLRSVLVPSLLVFAFIKFVLVMLWFMHLRFDSRVFMRLFVTGIVLALIIFGVVLWSFFAHGGPAPEVTESASGALVAALAGG